MPTRAFSSAVLMSGSRPGWSSCLTSTACPSSRSKPTTHMQCSQVEKRSHGSRRASSGSSSPSPPGPGGRVISSAGEMLLASWSSRSSGSSTCSPSSSGPCRAMSTARSGNLVALKECYELCGELVERLSGELSSGHNNWRKAAAQKLATASIVQRLAGSSYVTLASLTTSWGQSFAAFMSSKRAL